MYDVLCYIIIVYLYKRNVSIHKGRNVTKDGTSPVQECNYASVFSI